MIEDFVNGVLLPSIRRLTPAERRQVRESAMRFYHPDDDLLFNWLCEGKSSVTESTIQQVMKLLAEPVEAIMPRRDRNRAIESILDYLASSPLADLEQALEDFGLTGDEEALRQILLRTFRCVKCGCWETPYNPPIGACKPPAAREICDQCLPWNRPFVRKDMEMYVFTDWDAQFLETCGIRWHDEQRQQDEKERLKKWVLRILPEPKPTQLRFDWEVRD